MYTDTSITTAADKIYMRTYSTGALLQYTLYIIWHPESSSKGCPGIEVATVAYTMRVLYNIRLSEDANTTTTTTTRVKECIQGGAARGGGCVSAQELFIGVDFSRGRDTAREPGEVLRIPDVGHFKAPRGLTRSAS